MCLGSTGISAGDMASRMAGCGRDMRSTAVCGSGVSTLSTGASMVWNGFTVAPETIVDGIESLWPGEMRVYAQDGRELRRKRYWTEARIIRELNRHGIYW